MLMFLELCHASTVTIKMWDGSKAPFEVKVDPAKYISDMNRLIAPEAGIAADNQQLFVKDTPLKPMQKVGECNIEANSVLTLYPKNIKLKAELPDNNVVEVQVALFEDTSDVIKQKIENASFMPKETQVLKHEGEELPIGPVIRDMGLRDGDTLQVETFKVPGM
jgi:hypothetical protein